MKPLLVLKPLKDYFITFIIAITCFCSIYLLQNKSEHQIHVIDDWRFYFQVLKHIIAQSIYFLLDVKQKINKMNTNILFHVLQLTTSTEWGKINK